MPHIEISMYPGRDENTKKDFAEKLRDFAAETLNVPKSAFSVSIKDVPKSEWAEHIKKYSEETFFVKNEM